MLFGRLLVFVFCFVRFGVQRVSILCHGDVFDG
jgi:hypothetical protein